MTALSARKLVRIRNRKNTTRAYPVGASEIIYSGGLVMLDSTGYAFAAAGAVANNGCVGFAEVTADNSAGSAGDVKVQVGEGEIAVVTSGATQANCGDLAYASDDQTVALSSGSNRPVAGEITEVESATSVWVLVGPGLRRA